MSTNAGLPSTWSKYLTLVKDDNDHQSSRLVSSSLRGNWYYLSVASRYSVRYLTLLTFCFFFLDNIIITSCGLSEITVMSTTYCNTYSEYLKQQGFTAGRMYTSGPDTQFLKTGVPQYGTQCGHIHLEPEPRSTHNARTVTTGQPIWEGPNPGPATQ
jgi:hypothetical protein